MDGSILGSEPSTLEPDIVEGSGEAGRTIHVNATFHGRFSIQERTIHVNAPFRGRFGVQGANRPC